MKILLSLLGMMTLSSTSLIPTLVVQNNQIQPQNNFYEEKTYQWNQDGSSAEFYNVYSENTDSIFYFYKEMSLGMDADWNAATTWSIWDPNNDSITQIGWGNDPYYGTKLGTYQNISVDEMRNIDILSSGNDENQKIAIKNTAKTRIQKVSDKQGFAWMESETFFGTAHFVRDGEDFVAIYGYRTVTTGTTFSGGSLTLNIGLGMKINFDN